MQSLRRQALRKVPYSDIKDIPVDVISDILDDYFTPLWIIRTHMPGSFDSDNAEVIVYRARDKEEAVRMFIRDDLTKARANDVANLITTPSPEQVFPALYPDLYKEQMKISQTAFDSFYSPDAMRAYTEFNTRNEDLLVDFFLNDVNPMIFTIDRLEFGKTY